MRLSQNLKITWKL